MFLILNERGEIVWEKLIHCEEYTEPHNCKSTSSNGLAIDPANLRNFKTLILRNARFRLSGDFQILNKSGFSTICDFNNDETVLFEERLGKVFLVDLFRNKERLVASFNSEDGIGSFHINEVENHIYFRTIRIKYKRTLFEKYRDDILPPSTFRILTYDGKTLKIVKFDGIYQDVQISNDENFLCANSGTVFSIFRIR